MANRFGLARNIPEAVKREVRQRCGFGCIRCAACLYTYDHFDPDFADAKEHRAESIVLLCPSCHELKNKGVLTNQAVKELSEQPFALSGVKPSITLPNFEGIPAVRLGGGLLIEGTPVPLRLKDVPIVEFLPPEEGSTVTVVNAHLQSADDNSLLLIDNNEWIVESGAWDFEWVGQRISIRDSQGEALRLFVAPPNYIGIDRFRSRVGPWDIQITETEFRLGPKLVIGSQIRNCATGVQVGRPKNDEIMRAGGGMFFGVPEGSDCGDGITVTEH